MTTRPDNARRDIRWGTLPPLLPAAASITSGAKAP